MTVSEMDVHLREMAELWRGSAARPQPSDESIAHWRGLIQDWIADPSLPLLVRKKNGGRGLPRPHITGRDFLFTDNSPAQWAFAGALSGSTPTLDDVRSDLSGRKLPVAHQFSGVEGAEQRAHIATYPGALVGGDLKKSRYGNLNKWSDGGTYKLAHIEDVGLDTATAVQSLPLDTLSAHMRRLLDPGNMYAVPMAYAGVAEASAFTAAFVRE